MISDNASKVFCSLLTIKLCQRTPWGISSAEEECWEVPVKRRGREVDWCLLFEMEIRIKQSWWWCWGISQAVAHLIYSSGTAVTVQTCCNTHSPSWYLWACSFPLQPQVHTTQPLTPQDLISTHCHSEWQWVLDPVWLTAWWQEKKSTNTTIS